MIMRWFRRLLQREQGGKISLYQIEDDGITRVILSPGRSTTRRPGETWAEAMNRLTDGNDL